MPRNGGASSVANSRAALARPGQETALVTLPSRFELGSEFYKINYGAWRGKVESELKGAPFEKRMTTYFYEGIELQPLYTEEMFA
ncbi:MAG TPA: hypothetical protein VKI44_16985, partial [Acetobacteraceae bacterium]|nr:hypothetical protein [Acetobacteraceae bacterium]